MNVFQRVKGRIRRERLSQSIQRHISILSSQVEEQSHPNQQSRPVVIFNASTRLAGLSQNAAYSLLSSYGLRLAGVPVIYFVCNAGLNRCVLGTNKDDIHSKPPCDVCVHNSQAIFSNSSVKWFEYHENDDLSQSILGLNLDQLIAFSYDYLPLGKIIHPSLCWILRCFNLYDDENSRAIARGYILSAWNIAEKFEQFISEIKPQAVVVFNGMFYPEAMVHWVARKHGIPVFTHEVGMLPFSAFFTNGDATAFPVDTPIDFKLNKEQDKRLDNYLEQRFQGDFITAGVRFWPEMHALDKKFWQKAANFKQMITIFTNVVFDTSQPHANVIFPHMFAWLDLLLEEIRQNPDTLFIIRAHPDELRVGKESRESVAEWIKKNQVNNLPNVTFINPDEYVSSYELIKHSKFVMVYNSTVGLEASIMGKPVLCAGRARYTSLPTVNFPQSLHEFKIELKNYINQKNIMLKKEFAINSRRILYRMLFMASLPFDDFIESDGVWNGFVRIKDFPVDSLLGENSNTIRAVVDGILRKGTFLLKP